MRRFWIMLLVFSVALVIALPAGAKKPPKPTPAAPVAVSLEGNPMWVHEAGDVIDYTVTVQNKTRAEVTVEIVWDNGEPPWELVTVAPKSVETVKNPVPRPVTKDDIKNCLGIDEICDLIGRVTVQYPDGDPIVDAETSTLVDPVNNKCDLAEGEAVSVEAGLCIWTPPSSGTWELSAVLAVPPVPERPTNLMMTMRDHVPGNWCTLEDGTGGIVQDRWLPKSPAPVVLDVYLPGEDGLMGDGVCLTGGHGVCFEPDCYFAVGNPESFYLYTTFDGFITLRGPSG